MERSSRLLYGPATVARLSSRGSELGDRPGIAGVEERFQLTVSLLFLRLADLLGDALVVHRPLDVAEDAHRDDADGVPGEAREGECDARLRVPRLVHEQAFGVCSDDLGRAIDADPHAFVAPHDRLAGPAR